ncbi:energy transducer TonB, partial [Piscirickettsia litoralis]|uniref:energy transducer TonB n=1 Tax=Piscirickettsia litoralis TaxID=1891921 RepID=UPI001300F593
KLKNIRHTNTLAATQAISGDVLNKLVIYLNQVINAHKIYPEIAQELGNQGNVNVSFKLFPSGIIENLHIAQSSGYQRLDQAAIDTMKASVPFTQASQYIHQPQKFTLPIQYHLET